MPVIFWKTQNRGKRFERMDERIRKAAGVLLIIAALLTCMTFLLQAKEETGFSYISKGYQETKINHPALPHGTIDINTADLDELCELPGIGETIAALIIQERENNGRYYYPEDLTAVKGIGKKKTEQIKPFLDLDEEESGD